MASLALGTVGAVIGGYFGGPAGARLGFSVGVVAGGLLDQRHAAAKNAQDIGRLSDYPASGSSYGAMIPQIYGAFRTGGNIIEATPLLESVKKKGSKLTGTTTRTYSYSSTLAVMFCRGARGVRRIWAEDRVLYDYRAYPPATATCRVYRGSALQGQDSALVALHGASATPAYRNRVYAVFENLNLADWGNRIPNFSAEIADDTYPERVLTAGALIYYRFDDSDGKLSDSGTKGYTLTDTSPASVQVRGCFTYLGQQGGEGIQISGINQLRRTTGNDLSFQGSQLSVEAWFQYVGDAAQTDVDGAFGYINPSTNEYPFQLILSPDNFSSNLYINYAVNNTTSFQDAWTFNSQSITKDTNWHHLVVTYQTSGNAILYVDGAVKTTVGGRLASLLITSSASNRFFLQGGDIRWDEIAVYNTILDPTTVLAHYQSGAGLL